MTPAILTDAGVIALSLAVITQSVSIMRLHRRVRRLEQRGSALVAALVLSAVVAAVVFACLYYAPDSTPLLDQVENSVGQWIGGAL